MIGKLSGPQKDIMTRNRMDGTNKQLGANLDDSLPCHCDSPIVSTVVDHEQLKDGKFRFDYPN